MADHDKSLSLAPVTSPRGGVIEHAAPPKQAIDSREEDRKLTQDRLQDISLVSNGGGNPNANNTINLNVILNQAIQYNHKPDDILTVAKGLADVNLDTMKRQIEIMDQHAQMVRRHRTEDPDEVDKRKNNQTRRILKLASTGAAFVMILAAIVCLMIDRSFPFILVPLILAGGGAVTVVSMIPLASGESVSTGDIERLIVSGGNAFANVLSQLRGSGQQHQLSAKSDTEEKSKSTDAGGVVK